ncbi:MAG: hypothetical protein OEY93_04805 [Anaerolineae bacterium]|nr:hypothetical protein [Anaerolineae bacterium]
MGKVNFNAQELAAIYNLLVQVPAKTSGEARIKADILEKILAELTSLEAQRKEGSDDN